MPVKPQHTAKRLPIPSFLLSRSHHIGKLQPSWRPNIRQFRRAVEAFTRGRMTVMTVTETLRSETRRAREK